MKYKNIKNTDKDVYDIIDRELRRQKDCINLIASENYVSKAILEANGSIFTNKYAEGYPGKRYYGGCDLADEIEELARQRACILFGADHANVQPHSGSQANMIVFDALLKPGDTVLAMSLSSGGHLSHGSNFNFSGKKYNFETYDVDEKTGLINYDNVRNLAIALKPKLIIAGASTYSRVIDFKKFREIADECKAYLMVDMAHYAGLVAAGFYPNPVKYADVVTSTTHKTLRGPRGGFILCKDKFANAIDKAAFPGIQGGPHIHTIAAKAICFGEAAQDDFVMYQHNVKINAKEMAYTLKNEHDVDIVSGGTDSHMFLVDLRKYNKTGMEVEKLLSRIGIIVNKNVIPGDIRSSAFTSGIRIGTAAITTRGFVKEDILEIADIIADVIKNGDKNEYENKIRVMEMLRKHPLYE